MPVPQNHYFEVEVQITALPNQPLKLVIPAWTPGSYLIREYARHVEEFRATDGNGQPLGVSKLDKQTWQIAATASKSISARFRVYANDLTVRTSHLDSTHGYFNGTNLLPYIDGFKEIPATLVIKPPANWRKIATGLAPVKDQSNTFQAPNYDVLVDAPVLVGNFAEFPFMVQGIPHRIVIEGQGSYDGLRLAQDTQKIVETQAQLFGGLPYASYTVLILLTPSGLSGLEHLNSTTLTIGYDRFTTERSYRNVLSLISHELFHVWNVKRIRPEGLGPFDYTRETYTNNLWIAEGTTSYYENLMLRRSGLIATDVFLQNLADLIKDVQQTPGRKVQSLAQASFNTWIKFYRQDENSVNSSISYYDKGALVSLVLDLEIRKRTKGSKSLDDVFRLLNQRFGQPGQSGYRDLDFQKACDTVVGGSLDSFLGPYVYETKEIDYATALAVVGLTLKTEPAKDDERLGARPYLGATTKEQDGAVVVTNVLRDTPASTAGLTVHDEILAINGYKVDSSNFKKLLNQFSPGQQVSIQIFRGQRLELLTLTLGTAPDSVYRLVRMPQATAQQRANYESWLQDRWSPN